MEHLKIAFVLDDSLDTTDGVQQYVTTLGTWLAAEGHEVHYLVGETTRTDLPHVHSLGRNIKVRFNHNRMSIPLPVSRKKVRKLLVHEQYDIVHIQMPYSPFLAGRVVKAVATQTGVVGTFHIAPHSKLVSAANWLLHYIVAGSLKRFDEVVSVSKVAQEFAWSTFDIATAVVPNVAPLAKYYDALPLLQYSDKRTILFLGRLVERKGCQYLLRAVAKLHRAGTLPADCKVVICGKGPLEAEFKDYVVEQGLEDFVDFVGYLSELEKPQYLASADIAVFPSTGGESFGIVLLEAMAAARGVVLAGNNPGYAGVMGERPAALFEPKDHDQLAEKLEYYLAEPHERAEIHDWQRQYVQQFDVLNVIDEVLEVYNQALHKRRS